MLRPGHEDGPEQSGATEDAGGEGIAAQVAASAAMVTAGAPATTAATVSAQHTSSLARIRAGTGTGTDQASSRNGSAQPTAGDHRRRGGRDSSW